MTQQMKTHTHIYIHTPQEQIAKKAQKKKRNISPHIQQLHQSWQALDFNQLTVDEL